MKALRCLFTILIILLHGCGKDESGAPAPVPTTTDSSVGTWTAITTTNAPAARESALVYGTNNGFFIWGGDGASSSFSDGGVYNPSNDTWTTISTTNAPSARTDLYDMRESYTGSGTNKIAIWSSRVSTGDHYYGGSVSTADRFDGAVYDISNNTWYTIESLAGQSNTNYAGRAYMMSIWTGTDFFFLSGNHSGTLQTGGSGNLSTGDNMNYAKYNAGSFDGTDDAWSIPGAPTGTAPTARKHPVVAWTGTQILVWGGVFENAGDTYKTDGFLYNPSTNTWTSMSSTNAPTGRKFPFYVNTGSQLIVWGGLNGSTVQSDGAVYTYSSDTWTTISTTNAPSGRAHPGPTAWTGNNMVVWGGISNFSGFPNPSFSNDGKLYNPTTNTWTDIPSTTHLSTARGKHHIAYNNGKVFIWGGWTGNGNFIQEGAVLTLSSDYYQ